MLAVVAVFMVLFCLQQNRKMQETFMDNRKKIGDVNARLQDTLAGIRVVQSFANEDVERRKFRESNENFVRSKDGNYRCMGTFQGGTSFFQGLMYVIVLTPAVFSLPSGIWLRQTWPCMRCTSEFSSVPYRFWWN